MFVFNQEQDLKVFLLAYQFPPLNVGGSHRPLKMVKYLPKFNINPVVFSASLNSVDQKSLDTSLNFEIPESIQIYRPDIEFSKHSRLAETYYFNLVDRYASGWEKALTKEFLVQYELHKPHALIVTMPPFSVGLLALKLSKKFKIPLILDFRDLWTQWVMTPFASRFHYWLTLRLERILLDGADAILTVTPQMIEDFRRVHPSINRSKFHVVKNSYDGILCKYRGFQPRDYILNPLTIVYVGSFYFNPESHRLMYAKWHEKKTYQSIQYVPRRENWLYRTPIALFRALKVLRKRDPELNRKIRIRFVGNVPNWLTDMVSDEDVEEMVEFLGFLPRNEAEEVLALGDLALATSVKVEGGEDYCIAGKTYEYFQLMKPILAFVSPGAQKEIIHKSGLGIICNPDKPEDGARKIESFMNGDIILTPIIDFIGSLSSKESTRGLAKIIHGVVTNKRSEA